MCGRFQIKNDPTDVGQRFGIVGPFPNWAANYNAAPTQMLPVIRRNPDGARQIDLLRWGLVPIWAKDLKTGFKAINARRETVATSGMFRDAYQSRRCLIPANGFYEWQVIAGGKQPYSFAMADRSIFAFAGLWDRWKDPATAEIVRTFTIVTTTPNELVRTVHDRMPVILPDEHHAAWLGEIEATPDDLSAMLAPYAAASMIAWPVCVDVGNVRNNHAGLVDELNRK